MLKTIVERCENRIGSDSHYNTRSRGKRTSSSYTGSRTKRRVYGVPGGGRGRRKTETGGVDAVDRLCSVLNHLRELDGLIGMRETKETIANHLVYLAQEAASKKGGEMNHVQICGEPGTGKSTLARILGEIYAGLGLLENGKVTTVTRSDLVGEHLGSTSVKTEKVLENCRGGVLLIDEVYSFGCRDRNDSFAKECIDCLNRYLSEHGNEIFCIIAGYERDVKECFFDVNKGLERRFPWKYRLQRYTPDELRAMFEIKCSEDGWTLHRSTDEEHAERDGSGTVDEVLRDVFGQGNLHFFNDNGGDVDILITRCRIAHSTRAFVASCAITKSLTGSDIREGFGEFAKHKNGVSELSVVERERLAHMYL